MGKTWKDDPDFFRKCGSRGGKSRKQPYLFDSERGRAAAKMRIRQKKGKGGEA